MLYFLYCASKKRTNFPQNGHTHGVTFGYTSARGAEPKSRRVADMYKNNFFEQRLFWPIFVQVLVQRGLYKKTLQ
uniref:Uncharacterized protein n=1 Tax=Romanomermis culicivorax TaxID=13658 RepID=A0A915K7X9_ROMCU